MKRSEINNILREGIEFIDRMNYYLPPFAYWTPEEWQEKGEEFDEIRDNLLGWDITDFGSGDFYNTGLLLFTVRNGNLTLDKYHKPYAEKLMIVEEGQVTPYHFHKHKMEDIINRGGGVLLIKLYNSTDNKRLADSEVMVSKDGRNYKVSAGSVVELNPGESITLMQGVYHKFWGKEGSGKALVGEVSMVNDDDSDNYFLEERGRFPEIEEDDEPLYLLVKDY